MLVGFAIFETEVKLKTEKNPKILLSFPHTMNLLSKVAKILVMVIFQALEIHAFKVIES